MKSRTLVLFIVAGFLTLCGWVLVDAVRNGKNPQVEPLAAAAVSDTSTALPADAPAEPPAGDTAEQPAIEPTPKTPKEINVAAISGPERTVTLGAVYPEAIQRTNDPSKYKFQIELTTLGAAIRTATLSEFDNRDPDNRQPLALLSPLGNDRPVYSLANTALRIAPRNAERFGSRAFPLDRLHWQSVETDDPDAATFEAELLELDSNAPVLRLVKTYRVQPGSYDVHCTLAAENLTDEPLQIQMEFYGPVGLPQEDTRQDVRKIVAAYKTEKDIQTRALTALEIRNTEREKINPSQGIFSQLRGLFGTPTPPDEKLRLALNGSHPPLIWAAATNKYFAAIVRAVGAAPTEPGPIRFKRAAYIDKNLKDKDPAENAGAVALLESETLLLDKAGTEADKTVLQLEVFLGPKDKSLFEAHQTYRTLQYFQTIDFRGCCCPTSIIGPLAFGIIWLMKSLYTLMGPFGNYGIVVIFLVIIVRMLLHPVTKYSQVSMMRMQKLGPKLQEIQKKYANNKKEMNRQMMEVYREMGASPIAGMLPMFLQMPIWIALWTAVYTSVDLRGQGFLPFWITDLSAPDHLCRFPFGLSLPYFGEYLNLLPLLMGAVMYAQQKMMPTSQAAAQSNPQVAQQQKMMMIMFPLMFPLLLYHGPSGVNLYIMTSIGAGVIEQMVIRKHIREREEYEAKCTVPTTAKTGGKAKKKKTKPMYRFDRT